MGIWPDGSDGTDVNAVDRAQCGQVYLDDKTKVRGLLKTSTDVEYPPYPLLPPRVYIAIQPGGMS
jgi:hypothetical protein